MSNVSSASSLGRVRICIRTGYTYLRCSCLLSTVVRGNAHGLGGRFGLFDEFAGRQKNRFKKTVRTGSTIAAGKYNRRRTATDGQTDGQHARPVALYRDNGGRPTVFLLSHTLTRSLKLLALSHALRRDNVVV